MQGKAINFWDILDPPKRFYTIENVADTVDYINAHPVSGYGDIFIAALNRVTDALRGGAAQVSGGAADMRALSAAHRAAEKLHDKAVLDRDFIAAVRWRYVMTAVSDCARAVRSAVSNGQRAAADAAR